LDDRQPKDAASRRRTPADPISAGLRELWKEAEAEPVPDAFMELLDRIDRERRKQGE
jgi:hypothetical protein